MKTGVNLKLFEENWSFENYLKIKILKIIWELKFWKLFEKWSFENYLKIEVLKIKFGNRNFEELFKDAILKINK